MNQTLFTGCFGVLLGLGCNVCCFCKTSPGGLKKSFDKSGSSSCGQRFRPDDVGDAQYDRISASHIRRKGRRRK